MQHTGVAAGEGAVSGAEPRRGLERGEGEARDAKRGRQVARPQAEQLGQSGKHPAPGTAKPMLGSPLSVEGDQDLHE
eukprot:365462-Chlamydomonas_euryale.AAC.4